MALLLEMLVITSFASFVAFCFCLLLQVMCLCVWFIVKNVYTRIGKLYISQKRIRNVMLKPSFQWASECGFFLSPVDKQKKENLLTKNKLIAKLTTIRSSVQYKSVSQATMGEESVGHLVVKFEFWAYIKEWVSFNSVLNLKGVVYLENHTCGRLLT